MFKRYQWTSHRSDSIYRRRKTDHVSVIDTVITAVVKVGIESSWNPLGRTAKILSYLTIFWRVCLGITHALTRRKVGKLTHSSTSSAAAVDTFRPLTNLWRIQRISCSTNFVTVMDTLHPPPNVATEHCNLCSASSHNRLSPASTGHRTDANFITHTINTVTQYLLNNVTNAQTQKNRTRNKQNQHCI